jgi:hypothetical protein
MHHHGELPGRARAGRFDRLVVFSTGSAAIDTALPSPKDGCYTRNAPRSASDISPEMHMDADRFDALISSLVSGSSRRSALVALTGGLLGLTSLFGTAEMVAGRKRGKGGKGGKGKKKRCKRTCAGKSCGSDGCGGSCGTCVAPRTTCDGTTCRCPDNTEDCGGNCVPLCTAPVVRDPTTCGCCRPSGAVNCVSGPVCCSGDCVGGSPGICVGKTNGSTCSFPAQCASSKCIGGVCTA